MAFRLQPGRTIRKETFRLLQEQITRAISAAVDHRHPPAERARQARVACKKIRATLELVRCHALNHFKREDHRFRDAARTLADIRDQGASLRTLQSLHYSPAHPKHGDGRSFRRVREALDAHQQLHSGVSGKAHATLQTFGRKLKEAQPRLDHIKFKGSTENGFAFLAAGFSRSYARARNAFYRANKPAHDDALHTWRKRSKTHLNQCRLLERTCPGIMPPRVRELKRLTSLLGEEHDLTVLRERIGDTVFLTRDRRTVRLILQHIVRRLAALRSEALAMGQTLFCEGPRSFVTRVETNWKAAPLNTSQRNSRKARSRED